MKNIKLLLATTAMLSMSSMVAYADATLKANQTTLDIYADLVSPVTASQNEPLSFGMIQIGANSGGKKVVVGTADSLTTNAKTGDSTTADMLISTKLDGFSTGDVSSGELEFSGPFGAANIIPSDMEPLLGTSASEMSSVISLSFSNAPLVPGGDGSGLTTCGNVSDFVYDLTPDNENNKIIAKVGATLTLANDMSGIVNGKVTCKGSTTVTWVLNIPTN